MTTIQRVARVFGWGFVVIAIWGAVLTGTSMDADLSTAARLWGLFPINFLHNLVHLVFGLWGITASRSDPDARVFAVLAGIAYIVLSILGVFFPEGFGVVPIGGADIWLHAALGVALLLTGLTLAPPAQNAVVEPAGTRTVHPPTTASSSRATATRPPAQPADPGPAAPGEPEPADLAHADQEPHDAESTPRPDSDDTDAPDGPRGTREAPS